MEIIKVNPYRIEEKKIDYIARSLKEGKAVVLPTDTSYGLSANALSFEAIEKVFRIKGRLKKNPISIIVKNMSQVKKYGVINRRTKILFNKFLPGRLTIIIKKNKNLSNILTGGRNTIGIRMPDFRIINKIMGKIDFPITATSANISGEIEPYSVKEILKQFKNKVIQPDLLVDAGILRKNKPSTIVDSSEKKIKLIRKGPIKFSDVVKNLKK
jgi:L-threonylcarbamoyladenylate synthase